MLCQVCKKHPAPVSASLCADCGFIRDLARAFAAIMIAGILLILLHP